MASNNNKNVNFAVSEELLNQITQLAEVADRSLSAQIRYMLTQYIKEHSDD